jgi:uncharacterized protein (DUF1330 family)
MSRILAGLSGLILGAVLGAGGLYLAHHGRERADAAPAAEGAPEAGAKPAYLVVLGEVYDRDAFMSGYTAKLPPVYEKYGGRYLAAGRNFEVFEGEARFKSFVISKWPSMAAARAFWESPDYAPLKQARIANGWGRFDVYALEGLPDPSAAATSRN